MMLNESYPHIQRQKRLPILDKARQTPRFPRCWHTCQQIVKRINRLIEDIKKHPFTGIGKPEPLSADYAGQWSRRITKIHRITYHVTDDIVTITRMRDHYPAK